MAMLGHGVRERSNIFGKVRERKDWECLRRVGELVWEGGFGVEIDCVKKCLIKCYFD